MADSGAVILKMHTVFKDVQKDVRLAELPAKLDGFDGADRVIFFPFGELGIDHLL